MFEVINGATAFGGGGAALGAIIFFMYRQDKRASEKRLTRLLEKDQESREENTKALTEMTTLLIRLNGRLK